MRSLVTLGVLLSAVVLRGAIVSGRPTAPQTPHYVTSFYVGGSTERQVVVKTRAGEVLSVLDVPVGIELSIHVVTGSMTGPDDKTGATTFTGDVTIHALPSKQIAEGPSALSQMMKAPLTLDVQDVVVTLTRK